MRDDLDQLDRQLSTVVDAGRPGVASIVLDAMESVGFDPSKIARQRARIALMAQNPEEAVRLLGAAMTGSFDPDLFLWRARAHCALGHVRQACSDAEVAAQLMPLNPDAAGLCGTLLIDLGEMHKAAEVLEKAIMAGAPGPELHVALMISLAGSVGSDVARSAAARARTAHPHDTTIRRLSHATEAGLPG